MPLNTLDATHPPPAAYCSTLQQALLLHPDVAKGTVSDPDAFVRLVAAYELLLDPKARAQYHEKRWKQQQQEPTVASTQGPQQAAHHPDGHVHRQQRSGAQHSQPVTKHQHVSHAELQTWRYGVGHWLSATRARRAALAGGGGGQDDEDEGGIAATARVLLWKHRAELETDVGAALAHAFLGPRYICASLTRHPPLLLVLNLSCWRCGL
jgi:curved DNA-binding protein CbpA